MGGDRNWREKLFVRGDWLDGVTGLTGDVVALYGGVGVKCCHPVVGFGGAVMDEGEWLMAGRK